MRKSNKTTAIGSILGTYGINVRHSVLNLIGNNKYFNQKHYYQQHNNNTARTFLFKKKCQQYIHYLDLLPTKTWLKHRAITCYKRILITTYIKCIGKNRSLRKTILTNLIFKHLEFKFLWFHDLGEKPTMRFNYKRKKK